MMPRLRFALLAAVLGCTTAFAQAQDWPARPVTMVNPFAAGSAVDVVTRVVAQRLSQITGQQFNVENRTGASGNIGTEYVMRAKPDGSTFLMGSPGTMAINPFLFRKLPYDAVKDFVPVVHLVSFPQVLVVHPALPARTLAELVTHVRANAGKLNYASAGQGTTSHLVMELIKADAKLDIVHVPFRGGAPAIQAVIAGEVQMAVEGLPSLPAHLKAGTIRPIGVTSETRSPALPEVPAIAEAAPGFDATAWIIVFAPAGTPSAVLDAMARRTSEALADAGVRARLGEIGATVSGAGPAATAALHQREMAKFKRAVEISGAKAD